MEGVWAMSSDGKCEACNRFMLRMAPILNGYSDAQISQWLEALTTITKTD